MCIYIYSNTLYNDINNNRTTGAYVYIYIYIYICRDRDVLLHYYTCEGFHDHRDRNLKAFEEHLQTALSNM